MDGALQNPLAQPLSSLIAYIPDTDTLIWILFFVIFIYTLVHAVVFVYHWFAYNISPKNFLNLTYLLYFVGLAVFLSGLLLSTVAITS